MIKIPAGKFLMGDSKDGLTNAPLHEVMISAFEIDEFPVTYALWLEVYSWAVRNGYEFEHCGAAKAVDHPVHSVSWYDAVKWCNARTAKDKLSPVAYRLPTEAEWEKAARGGKIGLRFPWGDTVSEKQANYQSPDPQIRPKYDQGPKGYNAKFATGVKPYTNPDGAFPVNAFGLFDMAGNVSEWCQDWYGPYDLKNIKDLQGPVTGTKKVIRGGNWYAGPDRLRVAYRDNAIPRTMRTSIGFRCVRTIL